MAVTEELILRIRGDTVDIRRDFNHMERDARDTSRSMERSFTRSADRIKAAFQGLRIAALGVAAAGAAAVGGFAVGRQTLEAVETIQDLADRAGVSAERLQELRFAANQSGASARDLDDGLSRLNRRLGLLVTTGASPAKGAFEALGLSSRIASGELRDAESVFDAAVVALEGVENAADRAALASQLFGEDSGPRLANLVGRGAAGIAELSAAAREAGAVMSNDLVAGAAAASDEIEVLEQQIGAEFRTFVAENAEGLVTLAKVFADVASAAISAANAIKRFFDQLAASPEVQFADLTDEQLQNRLRSARASAGDIANVDPATRALARALARDIEEEQLRRLQAELDTLVGERPDVEPDETDRPTTITRLPQPAAPDLAAPVDPFANEAGRSTMITRIEEYNREWALSLEKLEASGKASAENITDDFEKMAQKISPLFEGIGETLEKSIVDALAEGRFELENFAQAIRRLFAQAIYDQFFRGTVNSIVGGIAGIFGQGTGGGFNLGSIFGGAQSAPTLSVPGIAGGAPSASGSVEVNVTISNEVDARGADVGAADRFRQGIAEQTAESERRVTEAVLSAITEANIARAI